MLNNVVAVSVKEPLVKKKMAAIILTIYLCVLVEGGMGAHEYQSVGVLYFASAILDVLFTQLDF